MAICYPQARFTLLDSIGKKVMVLEDMVTKLVEALSSAGKVEKCPKTSTTLSSDGPSLCPFQMGSSKIAKGAKHSPANGILTSRAEITPSGRNRLPREGWNLDELLPEAELGEVLDPFQDLRIPNPEKCFGNVRRRLATAMRHPPGFHLGRRRALAPDTMAPAPCVCPEERSCLQWQPPVCGVFFGVGGGFFTRCASISPIMMMASVSGSSLKEPRSPNGWFR